FLRLSERPGLEELLEVTERLPTRRARRPQRGADGEVTRGKSLRDLLHGHVLHTIAADGDAPRLIRCDRRCRELARRNCPSVAHLLTSAPHIDNSTRRPIRQTLFHDEPRSPIRSRT